MVMDFAARAEPDALIHQRRQSPSPLPGVGSSLISPNSLTDWPDRLH